MATTKEVQFQMIRTLRVADYVTLSNGLCGVLSIFLSLEKCFITAYLLIFLGYEFDRFDGIIARWRNECSELGKQLDSLSDLVTFVLAPVVMLYSLGCDTAADQAALTFFVLCGIARLARFNVAAHLIPKDARGKALYHQGLPVPYAGLLISTSIAVSALMGWVSEDIPLSILFPGSMIRIHPAVISAIPLGSLMISARFKLKLDGGISIPAATVAIFATCWSFSAA